MGIVVPDASKDDPSCITFKKPRLNLSNAGLIGLRRVNGNSDGIVKLDFTHSDHPYSVHAGQPVVLRATNPTGQSLEAVELLQAPVRKPPEIKPELDADLKIMVACGPYTLSDSNDPSLLLSLLNQVKRARPHVLILIGPIVDSHHTAVQSYTESTYEELCQNRLNSVAEYCCHLDVQLVVVPSCREAHHDPVYPTPPLDKTWTQGTPELSTWYRNVQFVWDPCLLRIGNYFFGVTSVDVLSHLSSEEISTGCTGDRIARLCHHLVSSTSFYPVHPPSDELPLDYLLWDQRCRMSVNPHCLIIPSRLRQFAKNVDEILFVNPGYVSRDQSAGSYACLTICGHSFAASTKDDCIPAEDRNPSIEQPSHSICGHTSVTVYHL